MSQHFALSFAAGGYHPGSVGSLGALRRVRKKKKEKDPQAPRKPQTSYMYFTKENRALLRRSNPETTFAQVSEMLSRKWNSLSEEEVQRYREMAEEDKKRYLEERSAYREAKAAKREPRLEGPPKKAQTAYMYFTAAHRARIQKENPTLGFAEVSRMIGSQWAALTEEERVKYRQCADKDRERYEREKALYESTKDSLPAEQDEPPAAPKKARTSYMYYTTINRSRVQKEHPEASFAEVSKILSKEWQNLSPQEMEKYKQLGDADRVRYHREKAMWDEAVEQQQAMPEIARPPRKAQTSYMYFTTINRSRVQKDNPGLSFSEISRLLSNDWHNMSKQEKQKYIHLADQDKARFQREKIAYEAQQAIKSGQAPPELDLMSTQQLLNGAPKKAQTSYMYYTTINRSRVHKQHPGASFAEVSKILSQEWGQLPKTEKEKYSMLAKADKQRYAQEKLAYSQAQAQHSQLAAVAAAAVLPPQHGADDKYGQPNSSRARYSPVQRSQTSFSGPAPQIPTGFSHAMHGHQPSFHQTQAGLPQGQYQQQHHDLLHHGGSQMGSAAHAMSQHHFMGQGGSHMQGSGLGQGQLQPQLSMQSPSHYISFTRMVW